MLYYTDWFPVVGGLLGLGGLFAWIAFVSGLLTDERKEQFQKEFERRVLLARRTWRGVLLVGAVLLVWASAHGSIVLQSLADGRDRTVEIRPASAEKAALPGSLPPNTIRKDLVLTGWWRRSFRVKVSGLPAAQIDVAPFQRRIVAVPSAFVERPAVLIRAEPAGQQHRGSLGGTEPPRASWCGAAARRSGVLRGAGTGAKPSGSVATPMSWCPIR